MKPWLTSRHTFHLNTIKLLDEVKDPKELLLIKDVIEGIEEMS